mgnify:CR=1 FL=1
MNWVDTIISAHTAVTDAVKHGYRMQSDRYFVWQEDASNDLGANNVHAERAVQGTTDLFSKTEFDPWAAAMEESFSAAGIAWYLSTVEYEEDTGFWHWEWVWEVPYG